MEKRAKAAPSWGKTATHQAKLASAGPIKHYARMVTIHDTQGKPISTSTTHHQVHNVDEINDLMGNGANETEMLKAYHTVTEPDDNNPDEKVTSVTLWLVDSGCSNHMTPFLHDIIGNHENVECVVEVATGVLVPAPLQGTVKIKLEDIYTSDSCIVLLHNVLYVPGLSKRLLSVKQ